MSLYFSVVEDHEGNIEVSSFMGRNRAEEKRFALSVNKELHYMTTDHAKAQRFAEKLREIPKAPLRQPKSQPKPDVALAARQVIEAYDADGWDNITEGTEFGKELELLRECLGMPKPEGV